MMDSLNVVLEDLGLELSQETNNRKLPVFPKKIFRPFNFKKVNIQIS